MVPVLEKDGNSKKNKEELADVVINNPNDDERHSDSGTNKDKKVHAVIEPGGVVDSGPTVDNAENSGQDSKAMPGTLPGEQSSVEPVSAQVTNTNDITDEEPQDLVVHDEDREPVLPPVSWPTWEGGEINSEIKDLDKPFEYLLDNSAVSGRVYGLNHTGKQVKFSATDKNCIKKSMPACVYHFSAEDRVGEMQAIWDLGGRFLLSGEVVLGGDSSRLDPEIMEDSYQAGDDLVLEVNNVGRALLKKYCDALGTLPGSLQIILPGKLWAAIYQSLFKVAVENKLIGPVYNYEGKEVSWRLKSHGKNDYSIIIQKSDLE